MKSRALIAMLLTGWYPAAHAAAVAACLLAPWLVGASWAWIPTGGALLYLFPPLAARVLMVLWGPTPPSATFGSSAFLRWWALCQLQVIFNRLPQLEELLRLVPALYSLWLCLWGSRVGRFVFWSPGVVVADRQLLQVGDGAVIGMGVTIAPHLVLREKGGAARVVSAPVVIGAGALVGGQGVFGPGAGVAPGETSCATLVLPPFSRWERGRRRRPPIDGRPHLTAIDGSEP
jgi:hypothetical protein